MQLHPTFSPTKRAQGCRHAHNASNKKLRPVRISPISTPLHALPHRILKFRRTFLCTREHGAHQTGGRRRKRGRSPGRRARAGGGRRPPRRTARVQPSFRRPYRGAGVGAVSLKTRRSAARRGTAERRGGGRGIAGSDEEVGGQIRGSKTAITRPRSMWSRCTRRTRNIGPVFSLPVYLSLYQLAHASYTYIYRCINLLLNLL